MSDKDFKNQELEKEMESKLDKELDQELEASLEATETAAEQVEEIIADLNEEQTRIVELEQALEQAEAKLAENMDLALRTKAEAENIRRRSENEVTSARKFAVEKFAKEMLAVVDSLEQGLAQNAEHEESIAMKQGMELTLKMTLSSLEKFGIEQLDPKGEVFDPQLHEAMTMVPSPEHESNTIIDVFQKGYNLNGRLIRPARVVVAQ